jgi:hypothetical protein
MLMCRQDSLCGIRTATGLDHIAVWHRRHTKTYLLEAALANTTGTSQTVCGDLGSPSVCQSGSILTRSIDNRYYYGLRTRRSDETLREDQRNLRLLRASAEGQLHRIQHLLRLGADVDFSDETEFTALHYAVLSGFEDCVQELVKWGSDVNAMTCYGVPLDLAAQKERNNVISILLGARADKSRAIAFAEDHGQKVSDLNLLFSHTAGSATMEMETWPDATCRNETRDEHQPLSAAADDGTEKEESNMEANDDCSRFRRSTDDGNGFGNDEKYIPDWQHCLPADAGECDDMDRNETTGSEDRWEIVKLATAFSAVYLLASVGSVFDRGRDAGKQISARTDRLHLISRLTSKRTSKEDPINF